MINILRRKPKLKSIEINSVPNIGKESGLSIFALFEQTDSIDNLMLTDLNFLAKDIEYIGLAFRNSKLKSLTLNSIYLEAEQRHVLFKSLKSMSLLTYMNLEKMQVDEETARSLFESLSQLSNLVTLILDNNPIKGGVCFFKQVINLCSKLEKVQLNNCFIDDIGLSNLTDSLAQNKSIVVFELNINKITNESSETIKLIFSQNETLRNLYLLKNKISSLKVYKEVRIYDHERLVLES